VTVTIYHNPACGTLRKVLALVRERGDEPEVVEYLKTPPDRATLVGLIAARASEPWLARRNGISSALRSRHMVNIR
jgi:arsenate reductase-like glutaredoxin family protein